MPRMQYFSQHIFKTPIFLKITTGGLKHLDPNSFRQTIAYNEVTLIMNWEQRLRCQ